MKRGVALLLLMTVLLGGCTWRQVGANTYKVTYLDLFDTVTTVLGTGDSEAAFQQAAGEIYAALKQYHQLFDIYHTYAGIHNLKTINDQAGIAPVTVDKAVIELLLQCRDYYVLTEGKVNVAMGSVLKLWHDARTASLEHPENAYVPDAAALAQAAAHMDFDKVIIDAAASTVYLADPEMSLDVGAIAKGWAAQRVAETAPAGMLISVGGNVVVTGAKDENGTPWTVAVQDPDRSDAYLRTLCVTEGAVVTSGDYQRYYTVGEKTYHHIIDPETGMPANIWRSVTVVCSDSALADALSTALFVLPLGEGQALARQCGAEALWLDGEGEVYMTTGFALLVEN